MVLRNLQIPALNKWTKLAPVLSQITLMANLFRVIARAFGSKLEASGQVRDAEASGQVDPEDADMSEGEILGAPSDSAVAFRKAAQRRMNKGYRCFLIQALLAPCLCGWSSATLSCRSTTDSSSMPHLFTLQGRTVWDVRILWRRQWPSQPCRQGSR